jgi:nucleoside-diphosphate-sugar epimerase
MILVTGATGFLGAEVARQLSEQGYSIRCGKRSTSKVPEKLRTYSKQIEWVEADLLNISSLEDAFDGVTHVYNCAAYVSLHQADKEPMIYTNVTGTANLVNLCLLHGCRLAHVSSVAAIGYAKPGELTTEKHHLDQALETDGYAISKLESEMEVWRGVAEGLDAVIVNPSIILGPDAGTEGSGELFETIRKGLKFYTDGGMGFVDVEDVAKCMIALMNTDATAERFIINSENLNYQDITAQIAKCFGRKPPSILAKPWMMELAWRWSKLVSLISRKVPAIDKVSARSASIVRAFDNHKIKKAVGIEFKPVSESIREVCASLGGIPINANKA